MRSTLRTCLLLAAVLSACGPSTGDSTTITKPGTGDPNKAPLEVLTVGSVINSATVDALIPTSKGNAFRLLVPSTGEVSWALVKDGSIYLSMTTLDGVLEHPILFVPAQVRDGMEWDSSLDGSKPSYHFKVKKVAGTDPQQWTIEELELATMLKETRGYTEGIGPQGASLLLPAQDATPQAQRPVELESVPLPAGLLEDSDGFVPLAMISGVQKTAGGPLGLFVGVDDATFKCVSVTGTTATVTTDCGIADGMAIDKDGTFKAAARTVSGGLGLDASKLRQYAMLPDATGGLAPLTVLASHETGQLALGAQPIRNSLVAILTTGDLSSGEPTPRFIQLEDDATHGTVFLFVTSAGIWWTTRLEGDTLLPPDPQGRVAGHFAVQLGPEGHTVLRTTGDGSVDRLHVVNGELQLEHLADVPVGKAELLDGAVLLKQDGDRLLVAKRTALRAVIGVDQLEVRGEVSLWRSKTAVTTGTLTPANAATAVYGDVNSNSITNPVGLICQPLRLGTPGMDWTFGGLAAQSSVVTGAHDNCRMFFLPPLPTPFPQLLDLKGTVTGAGVVRNGLGGGTAALNWTFISAGTQGTLGTIAGLSGGGYTDGYYAFARGGMFIGLLPKGLPGPRSFEIAGGGLADASGGLWTVRRTYDAAGMQTGHEVRYFGDLKGAGSTTQFTTAEAPQLAFPNEGGGVVVARGSGAKVLIAKDGTLTELGTLPLFGRLADGTFCSGNNGSVLSCQTPSGTPVPIAGPVDSYGPWLPAGNGILVTRNSGRAIIKLDVRATPPTLTQLLPATPRLVYFSAANGPDGAVWFSLMDDQSLYRAARLKNGVFQQLDLGASSMVRGGSGDPPPPVADDQTMLLGPQRFLP